MNQRIEESPKKHKFLRKLEINNEFSKRVLNPKKVLLDKGNIDLLEDILDRETSKLCKYSEFMQLCNENKRYSKEELAEMLSEAKDYVDDFLRIECSSPKIGHFSLFENNITSYALMMSYSIAGAFSVFSAAAATINLNVGLVMALPATVLAFSTYEIHKKARLKSDYSTLNNKINLELANEFIVRSSIAHEYVHHILFENKIFNESVDEGFARSIEKLYARHLAEIKNDDRYTYESAWTSCLAMNNAYKWACSKTGRKRKVFGALSNAVSLEKDSYTIGTALFRIMEEREGKDAYRNFIAAYKLSESFFELRQLQ